MCCVACCPAGPAVLLSCPPGPPGLHRAAGRHPLTWLPWQLHNSEQTQPRLARPTKACNLLLGVLQCKAGSPPGTGKADRETTVKIQCIVRTAALQMSDCLLLYCTVLHSTVLCTVLHCTTVLYCVLYPTVPSPAPLRLLLDMVEQLERLLHPSSPVRGHGVLPAVVLEQRLRLGQTAACRASCPPGPAAGAHTQEKH